MESTTANLMTIDEYEAGQIVELSVKTLQKRRWMRQPPRFLKMGRLVRYRFSDLEAFLDSCTIETGQT